jgi:hypothetical protein
MSGVYQTAMSYGNGAAAMRGILRRMGVPSGFADAVKPSRLRLALSRSTAASRPLIP